MRFKHIMERPKSKDDCYAKQTAQDVHNPAEFSTVFVIHSTAAMAAAGVSSEVRQKLTGDSSAKMNAQNTHHELAPLRAAIATIPSIGL